MTHRVIIRAAAEADITDAAVWYEARRPGLGHDFLAEIDAALAAAAGNPFRFPRVRRRPEVRRVLAARFPYRISFLRRADDIVVFRVLHAARGDREWTDALPDP